MLIKTCKKCHEAKPSSDYHKSTRCTDGFRGVCKVCNGKAGRARYKAVYKGGMGHNQGRVEMPRQDLLQSLFSLVDGKLVRKVSSGNCKAGSEVGKVRKDGYKRVWVDGAHALVHRLVWKMEKGEEPPEYIDHINGDKTDNRIENMRPATHGQNIQNQSVRSSNTSGFIGVSWYEHLKIPAWSASITSDNRGYHIGYLHNLKDALVSYEAAALEKHGEFAAQKIAHNREKAAELGMFW